MNQDNRWSNKIEFILCAALLGALTGHTTCTAEVSVEVGVAIHADSDFYEPLTPLGEWVVVGSYGRCWRPSRVEAGWRPYCNGSWQRTDAGWYWVSDEPWGWATYHYGRWDMNADIGWFWVPQTVWAPSWVSWHEGGGYIGWAPLAPSGEIDVRVMPTRVVFVEERRFLEPVRTKTVVVNNTTIINKTVINRGPQTEVIEKASGHKIQAAQVQVLRHKEEAAVVVKQRTPSPTNAKSEKSVQAPVRSEAAPREQEATPAKEQRQVEKPGATPGGTEAATTKKQETQKEQGKSEARPQAEQPSKTEAKPETRRETKPQAEQPSRPEAKPEAKPQAEQPNKREARPESRSEARPEAEKQGQKQEKPDKESEKKGEGQ